MYEIYTVRDGDTWEGIAKAYGTTVDVLKQINGIFDNYGVVTMSQIVVPVEGRQHYQYYTVKKGDNMFDIAKKNDVDYLLLLQLNGLDEEDYIYPNQTIMLPKKGYNIYLTMNDDTLEHVLKKMNVTIDELLRENVNIYLRPEQILVFRDK